MIDHVISVGWDLKHLSDPRAEQHPTSDFREHKFRPHATQPGPPCSQGQGGQQKLQRSLARRYRRKLDQADNHGVGHLLLNANAWSTQVTPLFHVFVGVPHAYFFTAFSGKDPKISSCPMNFTIAKQSALGRSGFTTTCSFWEYFFPSYTNSATSGDRPFWGLNWTLQLPFAGSELSKVNVSWDTPPDAAAAGRGALFSFSPKSASHFFRKMTCLIWIAVCTNPVSY